MSSPEALLDSTIGSVVAPAGCGKTQLIVDAVAASRGTRPILLLTHTNAGVAALRARLRTAGVSPRSYRLFTLDGWAMRLASSFPTRSGLRSEVLDLRDQRNDYPEIRLATSRLLAEGHIAGLLRSTYDRILVDEYQDCNTVQHAIIQHASSAVATVVLGDPLQAIFGFRENTLPSWERDVCAHFPVVATLTTPHRWLNVGAGELGEWLLSVRASLADGQRINLATAPESVMIVALTGDSYRDRALQLRAAHAEIDGRTSTALILADHERPHQQRRFASQVRGAVTVEAVELRDFVAFADDLDADERGESRLRRVLAFAGEMMTNVSAPELLRRVTSLQRGTARKPASRIEHAALHLIASPTAKNIEALIGAVSGGGAVRVYRPAVLRACFSMTRNCQEDSALRLGDAARRIRDEFRAGHRTVSRRAIGSTLLVKGLEADIAILLDASTMDASHLYVAMTRGSRRLVVCTRSSTLPAALSQSVRPGGRRV